MTYDKLQTVISSLRCLRKAGLTLVAKSTFLIAGAGLLSGMASGQVPSVNALPYVTEYQSIHVVPNTIAVPAAQVGTGFASLLGGGLGSIVTEAVFPAAAAAATASVRALLIAKQARIIANAKAKLLQDAKDRIQQLQQQNPEVSECTEGQTCTIAEEEEAQQAQEEVEALNESGDATQAAIEGAEESAEAAEVTAQAAEEAIQGAEIGIDVLEGVIDVVDVL